MKVTLGIVLTCSQDDDMEFPTAGRSKALAHSFLDENPGQTWGLRVSNFRKAEREGR